MNKLFGNQSKMFTEIDKASLDVNNEKIEKLKELFPNIVSDGKIDWNTLKLILGDKVTEEDERYRFTWNGKSKAIRESSIPSMNTLRPDKESSKNWDTTENLYIEGDNLEVLKILLNSYNGKIKMIYIDPPYNTGSDFIYEDDFTLSAEEIEKREGLKDRKGLTQTIDRLKQNTKDSAKYHTDWLNMMYSRLSVARDLLTDDGAIFISIDDNEIHNLRKLCDEIFGENNFEGEITWRRRHNQPNDKTKMVAKVSEYILIYSKKAKTLKEKGTFYGLPLNQSRIKDYKNPDNDEYGSWSSNPWKAAVGRGGSYYKIITPSGRELTETWYGNEETFKKLLKENRVHWTDKGNGVPRIKIYLSEALKKGQAGINFFTHERFGSNQEASSEVEKLFGQKGIFSNPKPTKLLKSLIKLITNSNEICLDFFSGSGSFADAVIQLNSEEKTNRRFILAQLPVELTETNSDEKVAFKYLREKGLKIDLCEIGKERIRLAGKSYGEKLDTGFKVFKLDSSNFNEWDTSYESMMGSIRSSADGNYTTYKEERAPIDLVYEILLKEGHQLTETIEEITVDSGVIYKIADGVMYIFLGKLTDEVIESIVEMKKEAYDLIGLDNPSVVLNEAYLDTEIKANAKKNFESNGIIDIKTL